MSAMKPFFLFSARCLVFSLSLVLALSACRSTTARCKLKAECAQEETCLPTGVCAKECTETLACESGEKCSKGGGCIPLSDCGADQDCSSEFVCGSAAQTCQKPCQETGCSMGATCLKNGHCSSDEVGPGASGCGGSLFNATRTPVNVLVVLDRSGSMNETLPSSLSKWDTASQAVKNITSAFDAKLRFGLTVFPEVDTQCGAGTNLVSIGDKKAATIASVIPAKPGPNTQFGAAMTPLAAALNLANTVPELHDANFANYVFLVTDGSETCHGAPIAETQKLFAAGIKTYVVGFGAGVSQSTLTQMASTGGTMRAGPLAYYQADDGTSLQAALQEISQGAAGCDFKLQSTPPELDKIYVYVNGTLISRDTSRQNGWDYSGNNTRVTLFGPACQSLTATPGGHVTLVYGCPDDTFVEGPGGKGGGGNNSGSSDGGTSNGGSGDDVGIN